MDLDMDHTNVADFHRQVRQLLLLGQPQPRNHPPLQTQSNSQHQQQQERSPVIVKQSSIPGAGLGVYYVGSGNSNSNSNSNSNNTTKRQQQHQEVVLCLYPGVYTPPMPSWLLSEIRHQHTNDQTQQEDIESLYLAKQIPPSGGPMEKNAYILNLGPEVNGGYIDGSIDFKDEPFNSVAMALESTEDPYDSKNQQHQKVGQARQFQHSISHPHPSWCGHLINHCGRSRQPNVAVRSFRWIDVIGEEQLIESHDHLIRNAALTITDTDSSTSTNVASSATSESVFLLPNSIRVDGSPWYYDPVSNKTVKFPLPNHQFGIRSTLPMLAGAAIVTVPTESQGNIQPGDELLLHYGLKASPHYPPWANDWYEE